MIDTPKYYFSNGKLLITGEYLVLKGAEALAMPVQYGQSLKITQKPDSDLINWETQINSENWLTCSIDTNMQIIESNNENAIFFLQKVLKAATQIRPDFNRAKGKAQGYEIIANIEFDMNWGLGSSSSLISNIAYWFDINPYDLHFLVSDGSAYDIACARANSAIIYSINNKLPEVKNVNFNPDFSQNIYFVYLGIKQDSAKSVSKFLYHKNHLHSEIKLITDLSNELLKVNKLQDFNYLIKEHESIISKIIKQPKVKSLYFSNFDGEIKSLGAWGGDFIMVSSEWDYNKIKSYFANKNLDTVFRFDNMKLSAE